MCITLEILFQFNCVFFVALLCATAQQSYKKHTIKLEQNFQSNAHVQSPKMC